MNPSPHVGWLTNAFNYRSKDSNTLLQPLQTLEHTHIKIAKSSAGHGGAHPYFVYFLCVLVYI